MNTEHCPTDMFLSNPSAENLCLIANVQLIFEEENYWTFIIEPNMHELLNGYFFSDFMSFQIPKNVPREYAKVERYFDSLLNKRDFSTKEKFIFIFSKRSRDDGFTSYWHFDFLLKPNHLLEILNSENSGFIGPND